MQDAITYTGMTQAFIGAVALWGWFDMIKSIKSGEVASDLSRPYEYYNFWLAQDLGRSLVQLVTRGALGMLVFIVFFGASVPASLTQWILLAVSTLLALLLSFSWRFLASAMAFWTTDAVGWMRIASLGILLQTGFMIPIAFMPVWLQMLCYLTPFPGVINTPVHIYLGRHFPTNLCYSRRPPRCGVHPAPGTAQGALQENSRHSFICDIRVQVLAGGPNLRFGIVELKLVGSWAGSDG